MISFARGVPAPECYAVEELADCARAAIERDGTAILSYGTGPGYGPLRERLADGHGVDPSRDPRHERLAPGLRLPRPATRAREARTRRATDVRPPAQDPARAWRGGRAASQSTTRGSTRTHSRRRCRRARSRHSSTSSRPSRTLAGRTLGEERRRRIVELAAEHDLLVLEDDPYGLIRFEGEPLPSLFDLSGGAIIYSSSFSKTISPGLRVGWLVLPEGLRRSSRWRRRRRTSRRHCSAKRPSRSSSAAAASTEPRSGVGAPQGAARCDGRRRWRGSFPASGSRRPEGGYFLWAELGEGIDAPACSARAEEAGVTVRPRHGLRRGPDSLRLAYSFVSLDEIVDGVARLAAALPVTA